MNLSVIANTCLTDNSVDKSIYYLTFSIPQNSAESLSYEAGDWLTVQPENSSEMVSDILQELALTGNETIELRRAGLVTSKQALQKHLELTQLNPAILNKLQRQMGLGDWADRQAMMDYAYGRDILDLLALYPELKELGLEFLAFLSPLAPRYYSIASAPITRAEVSILYKAVQYQTNQRMRYGVASSMLQNCKPGENLQVELKSNPTFKLPKNSETPIIMVGAGTGLAPFISFMQSREQCARLGELTGEALLFFGETHQKTNCLFCDEFKRWQGQGLVDCYYAFSRDQAEKVYVQHRIVEQAEKVWALINSGAHFYICGSQTPLAESVKQAMLELFQSQGAMSAEEAQEFWSTLKRNKRLQMDVY
ncbi:MAG: NADP oxidoreductase [Pseudomonadota bacterium]|nr:NADP oxidoreductase [Pseudomonadota bacterium]